MTNEVNGQGEGADHPRGANQSGDANRSGDADVSTDSAVPGHEGDSRVDAQIPARSANKFRINKARLAFVLSLGTLIASLSYAVGYLTSEHQHPQSLVDQAIARISSGDPHSPTEILLQRAAIEAVVKATKDRWSNYFPPATATAFDATLQGRYSGIGIWLRRNTNYQLEIASVQPNSPAALAGVKVGDQLLTVDGVHVADATVADAIAELRGNPNTSVTLGLSRNGKSISEKVVRASVLTGDVLASQIAPKTLYIQVSAISLHSADDVATALAKYPHTRGVILDLRDNPGGVLSEAVTLASEFLSPGVVVSYSRKDGDPQVMSSSNSNPDTAPMVVLINGKTASSAEIIAGALQDRNRAVVIGDQSFGKGTVQEITTLSDGSQLEITVGQYHLPSGRAIDQVGITPDLKVAENKEISEGISILAGLVALDDGTTTKKK